MMSTRSIFLSWRLVLPVGEAGLRSAQRNAPAPEKKANPASVRRFYFPINRFISAQLRVLATSDLVKPARRACRMP